MQGFLASKPLICILSQDIALTVNCLENVEATPIFCGKATKSGLKAVKILKKGLYFLFSNVNEKSPITWFFLIVMTLKSYIPKPVLILKRVSFSIVRTTYF